MTNEEIKVLFEKMAIIEMQMNKLICIMEHNTDDVDNMPVDIYKAAEITGFSIHTLRKYKREIGYTQRGRKLVFIRAALERWKAKFTHNPRK